MDYGARLFARLDAGFGMLAALVINRSGGIRHSSNPKVPGTPADPRDFMWQPPEPTIEDMYALFSSPQKTVTHGKKRKNAHC